MKTAIKTIAATLALSVTIGTLFYIGYNLSGGDGGSYRKVRCYNPMGNSLINQEANNFTFGEGYISFTTLSGEKVTITRATCILDGM